jgi:protein SCO1
MFRLAAALSVLAGALFLAVIVLATRGERERQEVPAATFPDKAGPFHADLLPDGVAGRRAPVFELADPRGGQFLTASLADRPYLVTFLFTDCTDICPVIGQIVRRAFEALGEQAADVNAIAISVDPNGDTPEAVRRWLRQQRLPSNFHYLIGSERELEPVWKSYFAAPQPEGVSGGRHTANIWLVDRRGRWRAKYSAGAPIDPSNLAADLRLLLTGAS